MKTRKENKREQKETWSGSYDMQVTYGRPILFIPWVGKEFNSTKNALIVSQSCVPQTESGENDFPISVSLERKRTNGGKLKFLKVILVIKAFPGI